MIIDAHQHFWRLSRGDYTWLKADNSVLYRDYMPSDLAPILSGNGIRATVLIQAAPSEAETQFLLQLAQANLFIAGVVGWTDFEAADVGKRIAKLRADGDDKLKGLRPMIQDIGDPDWILQGSVDAAFEEMLDCDLAFDALVIPSQLDSLRKRLLRHPGLRAVLDHAGKPGVANEGFDSWAEDLMRLARDTNVHCKLSGLMTQLGPAQAPDKLDRYVAHIFACFGPQRVLWGSDWPVLNRAGTYVQWLSESRTLVKRFAGNNERDVFCNNAASFYRLEAA
jgi:L-fuconolactonase